MVRTLPVLRPLNFFLVWVIEWGMNLYVSPTNKTEFLTLKNCFYFGYAVLNCCMHKLSSFVKLKSFTPIHKKPWDESWKTQISLSACRCAGLWRLIKSLGGGSVLFLYCKCGKGFLVSYPTCVNLILVMIPEMWNVVARVTLGGCTRLVQGKSRRVSNAKPALHWWSGVVLELWNRNPWFVRNLKRSAFFGDHGTHTHKIPQDYSLWLSLRTQNSKIV